MEINEQTSYNVVLCLLYELKPGNARNTTHIRWGSSPILCPFQKLTQDDRSRANILEGGLQHIWRTCWVVFSLSTAICLELWRIIIPQITGWLMSCNQPFRPFRMEWPALRNHRLLMASIIQLALGTVSNGSKSNLNCCQINDSGCQFTQPSIRLLFNSHFPTGVNWAGYQTVAQRVLL